MLKKAQEEVKDESRGEKPPTSRTGVNIERVRHVLRGDRRLNVRMIEGQQDIKSLCLKDYYLRFRHAESQGKNGAKITEWWSVGELHASGSEHYRAPSNRTKFDSSLVTIQRFLCSSRKPRIRAIRRSFRCRKSRTIQDS